MAHAENITFEEFRTRFSTEESCRAELFRLRFPIGFFCPKCGCTEYYPVRGRNAFQCRACRHQTSVTAGTVMHRTHLPLTACAARTRRIIRHHAPLPVQRRFDDAVRTRQSGKHPANVRAAHPFTSSCTIVFALPKVVSSAARKDSSLWSAFFSFTAPMASKRHCIPDACVSADAIAVRFFS